jgi:para-nitrobenzyl esterase
VSTDPDRVEVATTTGRVRGARASGGSRTVFRGVPFAAPPFGANRFRPPQPVEPWDGVRDATVFGPPCPQRSLDPSPERNAYFNGGALGEDCLTLNVWTPDPGGAGLPVMVWIHGGGYMTGTGSAPVHGGVTWARDGVVYVSINYRLGVEGFLYLGGETANLGLLDQVAALRWVQDNVAAFGGDPDNVTVFGQSGGAVSVMHLLAMPSAHGLFRRAVVQSGSTKCPAPVPLAERIAARVAELLGVAPTVDAMRSLPIERTLDATVAMAFEYIAPIFWGRESFLISPFRAVIDGAVLPDGVIPQVAAGSAAGVDVMAGTTRDECTFAMQPLGLLTNLEPSWLEAALDAFGVSLAELDAYRKGSRPDADDTELVQAAWTDWAFRMPTIELLDTVAGRGERAYGYEFAWPSPLPQLGATHALEIPFVNDILEPFAVAMPGHENPIGDDPPQALADRMHRAWVDFATTGDPGWPAYDAETRPHMVFDTESDLATDWAADSPFLATLTAGRT